MRFAKFTLLSLLAANSSVYANSKYNLTEGVSPLSHDIYHLHMMVFWVCVAIGIVVFGTMFYAIIYHRKAAGVKAAQFHEHTWVELLWSFIPFVILVAMAIPATKVLIAMNDTSQEELTIKVTGFQWKWKYEYLGQGISFFSNMNTPYAQIHGEAPKDETYLRSVDHPLVVPIHKKIRFLMTANDVIHSWWVPDLGVKRDALPGFINETWTHIDKPGIYHGQCTELCGINHAYMPVVVVAVTQQEFTNWVTQQTGGTTTPPAATAAAPIPAPTIAPAAAKPAATPTPAPTTTAPAQPVAATTTAAASAGKKFTQAELMQQGEKVFLNTCAMCHQATGLGLPPTYPALKGDPVTTGPVDAHINTVLNGKPGTAMQAFKDQLSDEDLAAVITYERNAWGNNTGTLVQPDDIKAARAKPP